MSTTSITIFIALFAFVSVLGRNSASVFDGPRAKSGIPTATAGALTAKVMR